MTYIYRVHYKNREVAISLVKPEVSDQIEQVEELEMLLPTDYTVGENWKNEKMIFDEKGKLLTGGDVPAVIAMLEGLRVDALGINCGMGPEQMLPILEDILKYASVPIIVKPNAGLPKQRDGEVYYDVEPGKSLV